MSDTGFYIAEVRFRGRNVPDATISLQPGLSVIAGPSNTGKSLLRAAINFVFGSSDPMKDVAERAPYSTILVEVRTHTGQVRTYERAWHGGDVNEYHTSASATAAQKPTRTLSPTHSGERNDNISRALLALAGFDDVRLLKNQSGETKSLSFRNLIEYVLVSEQRIITELSPIHSGSPIDATLETALFRTLLTGNDDRDVIKTTSAKEQKAQAAGREVVIEAMREDLHAQLAKTNTTEADAQQAANAITERINEQSRRLESYRTDLTAIEQRRRDLQRNSERTLSRITQIDANLQRFALLTQQYDSDLQRLQSNIEAGSLFGAVSEGPCPICGAAAEHHHAISQQEIDQFTQACRVEAEKINVRQSDLTATISQLQTERENLGGQLTQVEQQRKDVATELKAVLEPGIGELNQSLASLSERRQEFEHVLSLFEQLRRLDKLEESLRPPKKKRGEKITAVAAVPPNAFEEFATAVEDLLRSWSFPELERVVFDTTTEDIVVSGKARKDNGKGYRAITYAAFVIATLLETRRKGLPHPGFIVLDSPLVTYREPQEHIGEGVKNAFFRSIATLQNTQIIILENEEPPEDLKSTIAFEAFTKNRTMGRYGLFPPLPLDEA